MNCFYASTLIDTNIDNYRAWFHLFNHISSHHARCLSAWNQDSSYKQICRRKNTSYIVCGRKNCAQLTIEDVIQVAETIERQIKNRHARARSQSNFCSVGTNDSTADDHYFPGLNSGNPSQ